MSALVRSICFAASILAACATDMESGSDVPPSSDHSAPADGSGGPVNPEPKAPGALWVATRSSVAALINVRDIDAVPFEMAVAWDAIDNLPVVAPDGERTVGTIDGVLSVVVLDPSEPFVAGSIPLNSPRVLAWRGNSLVLEHDSMLYAVSDLLTQPAVLTELPPGWINPSVSTGGKVFTYSVPSTEGFDVLWLPVDGTATDPSVLSTGHGSAGLRPIWSRAQSLAYRTDGVNGGIWLWNAGTNEPAIRVTPREAADSEAYAFSPDDSLLLVHAAGDLQLVPISEPTDVRSLGTNDSSPGTWSPDGRHIHYTKLPDEAGAGGGHIVRLTSDGQFGETAQVVDLEFTCPQAWADETRLVHRNCGSDPIPIYSTEILTTDSSLQVITSALVSESLENMMLSPDGACLANWDTNEIYLYPATRAGPANEIPRSDPAPIRNMRWSSDSSSLLWIEHGRGVFLAEVTDCRAATTRVLREDPDVERAEFLMR